MTKISAINLKGEKTKDVTLNEKVWNIEVNEVVLKDAIRLTLNSLRQGTAKTKTRAEVSGGGKKPWKQKGTGRARAGSSRSPLWRGGGHVFAITPRSYGYKMNKKERVLALRSALSEKYQNKELIVIDEIKLNSLKTKDINNLLKGLKTNKKVLFVTADDNENLYMATRNLKNVGHMAADEINVLDIVNADSLVIDEASVKTIEEVLG